MNDAKNDVLKDAKKDEKKDAKESFVIGVGMKGLRIEGSKVQQGAAGAAGDLQLCRQESEIVKPRCSRGGSGSRRLQLAGSSSGRNRTKGLQNNLNRV